MVFETVRKRSPGAITRWCGVAPVHYFENTEGGHGSGVTPEQRAKSFALTMSYLFRQLVTDLRPS